MTYVQYPYDTLVSLGGNLQGVSDKLGTGHRGAEDCDGLGSDQSKIQDAIGGFRDEWKTSLLELTNNIGKWGGLTKAIGDMVSGWDQQTATALSPNQKA